MSHMNVVMTSSRFGGRYFLEKLSKCRPEFIILHEVMRKSTDSQRALSTLTKLPLDQLKAMAASEPETLWTVISDAAKANQKSVVMLVYYYHQPRASALWDLIYKEARIVHLVRRNLFEAFLSRQAAFQRNAWRSNGAPSQLQKNDELMELDEKELRTYINDRTKDIEWGRKRFGSGDYNEVFFEDITRTAGICLEEINRLFPVSENVSLSPARLAQPSRQRLSNVERVANYAFVAKFDRAY